MKTCTYNKKHNIDLSVSNSDINELILKNRFPKIIN